MAQAGHAVRVGLVVGARGHTKIAGFGVDGIEPAVGMGLDPGDVVADGADLPAGKGCGRDQHGEIGFAAGARESCCNMVFFTHRRGDAQNQHVFGQPTLVAAHGGGYAQRKTLFTQQGVTAVARAKAPDFPALRVVHDVFGGVAGPRHIGLAGGQRRTNRVHAGHEVAIAAKQVINPAAHAGHDALVHHHVGAVGQLHADVRDMGAQWAHRERHHVHGAPAHAAGKQRGAAIGLAVLQNAAHLGWRHPVVGRAGLLFAGRADEGAVLHARHIAWVRAGVKTVGAFVVVQALEGAGVDQQLAEPDILLFRAIAPVDRGCLGQRCDFGYPGD